MKSYDQMMKDLFGESFPESDGHKAQVEFEKKQKEQTNAHDHKYDVTIRYCDNDDTPLANDHEDVKTEILLFKDGKRYYREDCVDDRDVTNAMAAICGSANYFAKCMDLPYKQVREVFLSSANLLLEMNFDFEDEDDMEEEKDDKRIN